MFNYYFLLGLNIWFHFNVKYYFLSRIHRNIINAGHFIGSVRNLEMLKANWNSCEAKTSVVCSNYRFTGIAKSYSSSCDRLL